MKSTTSRRRQGRPRHQGLGRCTSGLSAPHRRRRSGVVVLRKVLLEELDGVDAGDRADKVGVDWISAFINKLMIGDFNRRSGRKHGVGDDESLASSGQGRCSTTCSPGLFSLVVLPEGRDECVLCAVQPHRGCLCGVAVRRAGWWKPQSSRRKCGLWPWQEG